MTAINQLKHINIAQSVVSELLLSFMFYSAAAPAYSSSTVSSVPGISQQKPLPSLKTDECNSASTVCSNEMLRQHLYQHLSAGYQLPTVWYNTVMKKSIIDPLLNFTEYDLPTSASRNERKDMPAVSTGITPVEDPKQNTVTDKMVLPYMITIRRKKMKKHKLRKLRKRMRFVMRKRRQLKEKRKEREIQQYEREQAKLGQLYSAEQYVDEQLALARKSGWHIDVIAEFNREREKEKESSATASTTGSNNSKH